MKTVYRKQILATILMGALLIPGISIPAQESPKQPGGEQNKVSDAELQAFAKAYVEYHKIRQKYEPQLQATKDDPQQSKKIQDEANTKIKDTLARQQLTPQQYNRLFTLVNNDETLRKKAMKLIEEERKKG
jgi:hypothetical protein